MTKYGQTRYPKRREVVNLKRCPFCGTYPEVQHIGNDHTKKRSIVVRCPKCRIQRTDSAIRYDFRWLAGVAEKNWNQRALSEEEKV